MPLPFDLRPRARRTLTLGLAGVLVCVGPARAQQEPEEIGLVEQTERRLAQIDVTALGPPELVGQLTAEDLRIKVHLRKIKEFQLDRLCDLPELPSPKPATAEPGAAPSGLGPASYLFYVDQNQLSLAGRQRTMELLRRLIPQLVLDGSRGMLVSNGKKQLVAQPLTTDAERLVEAVDRLENDREQWSFFAAEEDAKVAHVVRMLNESENVFRAIGLARIYQKEEVWRTEKDVRRLSLTLSRLSEVDPPKAVLYFADHLRSSPGEHYLTFFGENLRARSAALSMMATESLMATQPFDKLVNQAAAQGIRFYPVKARGMSSEFDTSLPSAAAFNATLANPSTSRVRHYAVRDTLANLATETGGRAFVQGERASKIARRVVEDFSCLYLVSFDPTGLPQDSPLRVVVSLREDGPVRLRVRGRMVLQSESARTTERLLGAFAAPDESTGEIAVRTSLVPIDFDDGGYSALLQLSVPATLLPTANWDLGASVVRQDKIWRETSGRLGVSRPGVPVIFETELRFRPGAYEIVAVAHEISSGLVSSNRVAVDWPDPGKGKVTVGPIAVLQPVNAAFLRDEQSRNTGSLARTDDDPVLADRPTALVGLVCRNKRRKGTLVVERWLVGDRAHEFPSLSFDPQQELCAQVRDLVPSNRLGPGHYRYEVRVSQEDLLLSEGQREFFVIQPGAPG